MRDTEHIIFQEAMSEITIRTCCIRCSRYQLGIHQVPLLQAFEEVTQADCCPGSWLALSNMD